VRILILVLGWVSAVCLYGQSHFSWQDYCFKNPASPVCKGNDYAVKHPRAAQDNSSKSVVVSPFQSTSQGAKSSLVKPASIIVGGVDWRFADPFADVLVGFNFSRLSASPIARNMIAMAGAKHGLRPAEIQKVFDGLAGVDQIALSIRSNRVVAMVTGSVADSTLPVLEAALKIAPVSAGAMLVGHASTVDQAIQRIAMNGPSTEWIRSAEARQASSEFWAIGSAGLVGPQATGSGVKGFSLTVWIRDRLTSDVSLEFSGAPSAGTLAMWRTKLGNGAVVEGKTLHLRTSLESDEIQEKADESLAGPLGQGLAALLEAARYLPTRDSMVPQQMKPKIYGLDTGADSRK